MNLEEWAKRLEMEKAECLEFLSLFQKTTVSELSNLDAAIEKKEASIVEKNGSFHQGGGWNPRVDRNLRGYEENRDRCTNEPLGRG